jgi:hypothetical protein
VACIRALVLGVRAGNNRVRVIGIVVVVQFVGLATVALITNFQYFFLFNLAALAVVEVEATGGWPVRLSRLEAERDP